MIFGNIRGFWHLNHPDGCWCQCWGNGFGVRNPNNFYSSGLFNLNCVNHVVESQQMEWEMMFPDYIIRNVLKLSGLCNPNCISTEAEAICFGWASGLEHLVNCFGLWPFVQTENLIYNIQLTTQYNFQTFKH